MGDGPGVTAREEGRDICQQAEDQQRGPRSLPMGCCWALRCWLPSGARSWRARLSLDPEQVQTPQHLTTGVSWKVLRNCSVEVPQKAEGSPVLAPNFHFLPKWKCSHCRLYMVFEKETQTSVGEAEVLCDPIP